MEDATYHQEAKRDSISQDLTTEDHRFKAPFTRLDYFTCIRSGSLLLSAFEIDTALARFLEFCVSMKFGTMGRNYEERNVSFKNTRIRR